MRLRTIACLGFCVGRRVPRRPRVDDHLLDEHGVHEKWTGWINEGSTVHQFIETAFHGVQFFSSPGRHSVFAGWSMCLVPTTRSSLRRRFGLRWNRKLLLFWIHTFCQSLSIDLGTRHAERWRIGDAALEWDGVSIGLFCYGHFFTFAVTIWYHVHVYIDLWMGRVELPFAVLLLSIDGKRCHHQWKWILSKPQKTKVVPSWATPKQQRWQYCTHHRCYG